jgi:hypothetical protein
LTFDGQEWTRWNSSIMLSTSRSTNPREVLLPDDLAVNVDSLWSGQLPTFCCLVNLHLLWIFSRLRVHFIFPYWNKSTGRVSHQMHTEAHIGDIVINTTASRASWLFFLVILFTKLYKTIKSMSFSWCLFIVKIK